MNIGVFKYGCTCLEFYFIFYFIRRFLVMLVGQQVFSYARGSAGFELDSWVKPTARGLVGRYAHVLG